MKETGIIMSGDHPQKILADIKTLTRRTYGLERINKNPDIAIYLNEIKNGYFQFDMPSRLYPSHGYIGLKCPYGQAGDRLWVRETYVVRADGIHQILYKADYESVSKMLDLPEFCKRWDYPQISIKWKPSIHMFRKDSRITLEITGVRVERLQEVTSEDILAEGIRYPVTTDGNLLLRITGKHPPSDYISKDNFDKMKYVGNEDTWIRAHFAGLWDDLNFKRDYGWLLNPWVWTIEFRRLTDAPH